jgi:amino acid permease
VKWYGESEFWLAGGKVILFFIVVGFTFVTMVGGNPQHDAYGFRYWNTPVSCAILVEFILASMSLTIPSGRVCGIYHDRQPRQI